MPHPPPFRVESLTLPSLPLHAITGAKAAGSVVTNALSDSVTNLVQFGGLVSVGISVFLVWVAAWMGTKFDEYTATGFVVGEDGQNPAGPPETAAADPIEPRADVEVSQRGGRAGMVCDDSVL